MSLARVADRLMAHALALPEAWVDHPWGERVAKVGKKVFLFFGKDSGRGEQLSFAVKLPQSGLRALDRPECEPTGYGMGKHGWVSAKYERGDTPPVELIEAWIVESYRAIASKELVAILDGGVEAAPRRATKVAKKSPAKKTPAMKTVAAPAKRAAAKPRKVSRGK
jgi:predicted DNA-binding protein (MmcQ/YjbR family)